MERLLKNKSFRKKFLFTLMVIVISRLGSQLPIPGIDKEYIQQWFSQNTGSAFNVISAFTGGSFERMSVFALNITPYITASIIIQLLTIAIPSLEELQRDGKYGQEKVKKITIYTAIGLALMESIAMAIGFVRSNIIRGNVVPKSILMIVLLVAGTGLLIFLGEMVEKKGIGNGISIILLANILSRLPSDIATLFTMHVFNKTIAKGLLAAVVILGVILLTVIFTVNLNEAVRKIPVSHAQKMSGRKLSGPVSNYIPLKVNTASVIPIIFASSLMSIPQIFASLLGKGYGGGVSAFILNFLNQNNWFDIHNMQYSVGLLLYIVMTIFFAYFYTNITFNPIEIADNLKKQGAMIPGIRPGKPTQDYLQQVVNKVTLIGAVYLTMLVLIPIALNGIFKTNVSFGGTSLIIVVGVIIETAQQISAEKSAQTYRHLI